MVLPVFMYSMIALASIINIITINIRLQNCMYEKARVLALSIGADGDVDRGALKDELMDAFGEENWKKACVLEKEGPEMTVEVSPNRDYTVIQASYHAIVPFSGDMLCVPVDFRVFFHNWTGYIDEYRKSDIEETIVYVAQNESVYHVNRECSYINVSIKRTSPEEVGQLRNASGGKYKKCLICHSSLNDPVLFVTKEGDRYHNDLNCSACKRIVRAIKLSEAGNLKPCSRCGR